MKFEVQSAIYARHLTDYFSHYTHNVLCASNKVNTSTACTSLCCYRQAENNVLACALLRFEL